MSGKNEPAFPIHGAINAYQFTGMTLRDYFAVHASDEDVKAQIEVIRQQQIKVGGPGILPDDWHTKARYMHADLMLKARES